ncbi:MAG: tetratricopeptide repeat protein [Terracidiphilus sp.]
MLAAAAMVVAWCAMASPQIGAQTQPAPAQTPPAQPAQPTNNQNKPATPPSGSNNPFPEDETTVPVMPNRSAINLPTDTGSTSGLLLMPGYDLDPVHSPDEGAASADSGSSSSLSGIDAIAPDADTDAQPAGKHGRRQEVEEPEHQETAAEDENVGKYYLDTRDWKAALSRFESALVLDPDNPDVYWGLAESERHLGRFADARENYQKIMEYDPGSHHAKEASKALKDPEIANAKAAPALQPATAQPQ